jgi:putative DNA primase/helicase
VREKWENEHGALPQSIAARTPRGGRHTYYRTQTPVKSRVNLYPGIDVRGTGGYVLLPPSVVNGKPYQWITPPGVVPIADADSIVYTFLSPVPADFDKRGTPYQVPETIADGQRTNELMKLLGSLQAKGLSDEAIRATISVENEARCTPPLTDKELEQTVFAALKRFQKGTAPYTLDRDYSAAESSILAQLNALHPEQNKRYGWHDAGNGNLFSDLARDICRYVPERKMWYFYDGTRWAPDVGSTHAMNYCKSIANALLHYVAASGQNFSDENRRQEYIKHITKWQQLKCRKTILEDAATVAPVKLADFDRDPWLLNCLNGTLNLKTIEFKPHSSADYITKLAGVAYQRDARCARWEQFIDEITCNDPALARYIQKAFGYALTGDTRHECFFILYGASSRNGKGTLCETFMRLVGDYGRTASPDSIAQQKFTDARKPSEDIARLFGARFVNMSEPDKKMILCAALVKTLTGNDTIAARFLGENSFEFKPQFKLFINTNHLPYVSDSTVFSSDRVKVIPFNRHFSEAERDTTLKLHLARPDNLSGILNWCLSGLRLLEKEDWKAPEAVKAATADYSADSDKIGQFISDMLTKDPAAEVSAKNVHIAYQDWCFNNGLKPEGFTEFKKSMASAQVEIKRKRPKGGKENCNKAQFLIGYDLKPAVK